MPDIAIRKARPADVPPMIELINGYARAGLMLPRTERETCEAIRDFSVALRGQNLAGCAALHFYTPKMAELRSLAVSERVKSAGVGRRLVEALVAEARDYGLDAVFAFTYVVPFFQKCGFQVVDRGSLPLRAWKDCIRCSRFQSCDEVPVVYLISEEARMKEESQNGLIHLSSYITHWPAVEDEQIPVPTPAVSGFQGR
jgi:amino-acid N-acetyltransferase